MKFIKGRFADGTRKKERFSSPFSCGSHVFLGLIISQIVPKRIGWGTEFLLSGTAFGCMVPCTSYR